MFSLVDEKSSSVTDNLETLFVTVTGSSNPIMIGVVYRPPNGCLEESVNELSEIMEALPKRSVHLMGDFNINLLNENSKEVQMLEDTSLGLGFSPVISTYTHEKPGCKKTCIDNIFTNESDSISLSGTLKLCISHHLAVFQIFNGISLCKTSSEKCIQHYDYIL